MAIGAVAGSLWTLLPARPAGEVVQPPVSITLKTGVLVATGTEPNVTITATATTSNTNTN